MPTVKLRFPGGRYHATPWGHHVNEGLIEWPPSPWRLLRAFVCCGFSSQGWSETPPEARQLIDKLAAVLPLYRLPTVRAAHSRHYMPIGALEKGREKTTLVFDTWANIGDRELMIHWPCELGGEEAALFGQLLRALGYLGRSESWVEAQLTDDATIEWNAAPSRENESRGPGWEQVSLMAAIPPSDYAQWYSTQVEAATQPFQNQKQTAAVKKKVLKAVASYPPDLLACFTKDTAWWKSHGWSQPPGSQRVLYWRRSDALQGSVPAAPRRPETGAVECVLLSLATTSGNRSALPPVSRTLPQAELFHRAIVSRLGEGGRVDCPEITGKDESGLPLRSSHQHVHTIPVDLDGDGRLDHILIYARMGLRGASQRAIRTLRRTWTKGGSGDLQVAVVGSGALDMLRTLLAPLDRQIAAMLGPLDGARTWQSATPFVPPRYLKGRGKNALAGQLQAELAVRQFPAAANIEIDPALTRNLRNFIRRRTHGGVPPKNDAGYGLRVTFDSPLHGPLLLGYASHYGLGRFDALD